MKLAIYILTLLFVSCYNKAVTPEPAPEVLTTNATIAQLKKMCNTAPLSFTATAPVTISGTVVSSDKEGYISGAIYIDDGTATAKILVSVYDLHSIYPLGARITLYMPELTAAIIDNQLSIGLTYNGDEPYPIKSIVLLDKHITCSNSTYPVEPLICTVDELTPSLCGKLVTINSMTYVYTCYEEGYDGKYLRFSDSNENFTYVYIDNYAAGFSNIPPQSPTQITGIVTYQNVPFDKQNQIVLLPRSSKDIWQ